MSELLRDSLVWIPCNVVMGEADQKFLEELTKKDEDEVVGKTFSAIEDIFEAMNFAMDNEQDVVGIVVDAFSNPIVIDKGLFDIIGNMKSRLVEK